MRVISENIFFNKNMYRLKKLCYNIKNDLCGFAAAAFGQSRGQKNSNPARFCACNITVTKGGLNDVNEKEIIKRCQSGDKTAFDELIRAFYPYVGRYLLKLTRDENTAEDLTQDVFLKVIRTIDDYKINGRASFATYIITIAKNTFIDYTRRNRTVFAELSDAEPQSGENVEKAVIDGIEYNEVVKYINALPPNQAEAIRLKYIEEYTLKEIEAITGVPSKTVKSRIHEGTKKLRSIFNRGKDDFYGKG